MKKLLANSSLLLTIAFLFFMTGLLVGKRNGDTIPLKQGNTTPVVQASVKSSEKININTATLEELASLPGIGETLAERIIDYRDEVGSLYSIYELEAVSGIGDKKIDAIKDLIYAG